MALRELARAVPDPRTRARLTPDYTIGCKRILLSSDYWPTFARDDVSLVTDPITRVEPRCRGHRRRHPPRGRRPRPGHRLRRERQHRPHRHPRSGRSHAARGVERRHAHQPRHHRRRLPRALPPAGPQHRARPHQRRDDDRVRHGLRPPGRSTRVAAAPGSPRSGPRTRSPGRCCPGPGTRSGPRGAAAGTSTGSATTPACGRARPSATGGAPARSTRPTSPPVDSQHVDALRHDLDPRPPDQQRNPLMHRPFERQAFEPKVSIVTGGASGIGRAIAAELIARGSHVVVADIDGAAAARTAAELGVLASAATLDVADAAAVTALVQQVVADHGRLDVMVNNAGVAIGGAARGARRAALDQGHRRQPARRDQRGHGGIRGHACPGGRAHPQHRLARRPHPGPVDAALHDDQARRRRALDGTARRGGRPGRAGERAVPRLRRHARCSTTSTRRRPASVAAASAPGSGCCSPGSSPPSSPPSAPSTGSRPTRR